jgi:hypothetical protein
MSYDLALHTTNGAIARESRRVARGVCHVQGDGQIRQADIDTEADVTDGKLGAITSGTMHAMTAVANVARLEMVLAQNFPSASGRLAYLAEGHMLAAGDMVEVMVCRVRHK